MVCLFWYKKWFITWPIIFTCMSLTLLLYTSVRGIVWCKYVLLGAILVRYDVVGRSRFFTPSDFIKAPHELRFWLSDEESKLL